MNFVPNTQEFLIASCAALANFGVSFLLVNIPAVQNIFTGQLGGVGVVLASHATNMFAGGIVAFLLALIGAVLARNFKMA